MIEDVLTVDDDRPVDEVREERKAQVALGYRIFAALRWGDLGDGHISARDPERPDCFWLLRWGVSYHAARVADLVLVGPDGGLVEGDGFVNPAAYHIHHPILMARPDVVSIAHVHTPWGTPFAAEARAIEPITQESCIFFEDHAIFDDDEIHIQDLDGGKRIGVALGGNRAIVLRNHGLLTVGPAVDITVGSFVTLERVAESHLKARQPARVSAEAARHVQQGLGGAAAGRSGFWCLVARHVTDPSAVLV